MVHIVLAILKIIGIILLIVLGIAAALVLLVLFWPVEYRSVFGKRISRLKQKEGLAGCFTFSARMFRSENEPGQSR